MKKFIYLCGMILLSLDITAQIDPNDQNWECFIDEHFAGNRYWDANWKDRNGDPNYQSIWRCYANEYWFCGATTKHEEHQAFQPDYAVFGSDQTMKLVGEFHSQDNMWCGEDYEPAPAPHRCDTPLTAQHQSVHYYSGMIETINPVGFGYYEVECKMPVHDGACSSFWFWSCLGGTYNEIDVFEYGKALCFNNIERGTLSGIWYNPDSTNYSFDSISGYGAHRYHSTFYELPNTSATLESYHRFGCLWLPEKVEFYIDGNIVNECDSPEHIPQFPMWLKIMHLEDDDAIVGLDENNHPIWGNWNDEMTINYVKAYRLKTNCNTDVTIRSISDFNNYDYSVKHSIAMGAQTGVLTLQSDSTYTMRAVESITIDGGFEVPIGTELILITQECPQW